MRVGFTDLVLGGQAFATRIDSTYDACQLDANDANDADLVQDYSPVIQLTEIAPIQAPPRVNNAGEYDAMTGGETPNFGWPEDSAYSTPMLESESVILDQARDRHFSDSRLNMWFAHKKASAWCNRCGHAFFNDHPTCNTCSLPIPLKNDEIRLNVSLQIVR